MFKQLDFRPLPGFSSPHLQMVLSTYGPVGQEPLTKKTLIPLSDGDLIACEISTPIKWQSRLPTLALVHGLGGSYQSSYMIRLSRKFYEAGLRVVRINLRGCGSGHGLCSKPYNSGNSADIREVLEALKRETPDSPIQLIGFSLGGNIIMKMAGELGTQAHSLVDRLIAVCPALDLAHSIERISLKKNLLYHRYYLNSVLRQGQKWLVNRSIDSLYDFDERITAPLWGYSSAREYYEKCSSAKFIPQMSLPCDILLAADDPFIDHKILTNVRLPPNTRAWLTSQGAHMGFIGWTGKEHGVYWLDHWLFQQLLRNQNRIYDVQNAIRTD